jgi:DNA-binding MarR family transcriptional regulator
MIMHHEENESKALPHLINRASNLLRRAHHYGKKEREQSGVGPGQGRLLHMLQNNDGLSLKDLVELMDIRPSSLGELVEKLAQNSYVTRRVDEADRRVTRVFLTESGRQKAAELSQQRDARFEERFRALTEADRTQLVALLQKLNASLEENLPDEADCRHGHHGHGPHGHGCGPCKPPRE